MSPRALRGPATVTAVVASALAAGLLAAPQPAAAAEIRIHDIQGSTRISPFAGKQVSEVPGTVTAIRAFGSSRGFWFQDPHPDRDRATSEAIFVYTGSTTPSVAVGDAVRVSGTVSEYYPGGADAGLQSVTELTRATWTVESPGNALPAAVALNPSAVPDRYAPDASGGNGGNIEPLRLRPNSYALDRYESLEGMRVQVKDAPVVGATSPYDELWVTAEPGHARTARGGALYSSYRDPNAGRVKVASLIPFAQRPFPVADVGDRLTGTTAGPLDYDNFGGYEIQATALGELTDGNLARETTRGQKADELSIATYNVENLSPKTAQAKFDRLASGLVHNLASPDIVALEEVQDDNGPTNDAVTSAGATLKKLTDAIAAAGGPAYEWRQIDPADDQDGGQPGGNIRVAFLFNPERVSFTDVAGGDATTAVRVTDDGGTAGLSASPGRIDPQNPIWKDSRKPLVGQFSFRGRPVFVIANHFNSKGGDQGLDGRFQPPARSSETQRTGQAEAVNAFVKKLLAVDARAQVVVAGDLNDYQFSPALADLTDGGVLTDLVTGLPKNERYGYVYNGNSQVLDHILTSRAVRRPDYDIVHINAEFADQSSDHDPQIVRLKP
ncbi:endonuclease/exonuclease/phosphatase family protein [Streptomyces sp. ME19-01-6]|uniref:endonuclease/exonuclease/phosphatase family protein n=1 Tax=Streptomyces sp. ME19-01-6 TaxID=3028686 RepID=UPI0029A7B8FE|nr:endonuclease/exonuclease/phosphatase family protein [Streptomyces sp. ME19-01-6]MDX3231010.1 endonuclease/exonuclease/phosphatase family protein [Streptomyces sp. ME19-01-6]